MYFGLKISAPSVATIFNTVETPRSGQSRSKTVRISEFQFVHSITNLYGNELCLLIEQHFVHYFWTISVFHVNV